MTVPPPTTEPTTDPVDDQYQSDRAVIAAARVLLPTFPRSAPAWPPCPDSQLGDLYAAHAAARWPAAIADREHLAAELKTMTASRDRLAAEAARERANADKWRREVVECRMALEGDPARLADATRLVAAALLADPATCPGCGEEAPADEMGYTGDSVQHADGCPMALLLDRTWSMESVRSDHAQALANVSRLEGLVAEPRAEMHRRDDPLPTTRDGVTVVPGMTLYRAFYGGVREVQVTMVGIDRVYFNATGELLATSFADRAAANARYAENRERLKPPSNTTTF